MFEINDENFDGIVKNAKAETVAVASHFSELLPAFMDTLPFASTPEAEADTAAALAHHAVLLAALKDDLPPASAPEAAPVESDDLPDEELPPGVEDLVGMAVTAPTKQEVVESKRRTKHQRIAEAIGETVQVFKRPPTDAVAVMRDGVLVTTRISWWKGNAKLSMSDLALNLDPKLKQFANSRLKLGSKLLLDKALVQELHNTETLARRALYENSIRTSYGWFLPTNKYAAFKAAFFKHRALFMENLDALCEQLPAACEAVYQDFLPLAHVSWQERRNTWTERDKVEAGFYKDTEEPTELFLADFLGDIAAQIPDPVALKAKAVFEYTLSVLHAPEVDLAAEYATGSEEANADLQKHLQKQKQEYIDKFVLSLSENLVEGVKKLTEEVTKTIGKKQTVHGLTLTRVLNTVAQLRDMNLLGNPDVEAQLSKLETFIELKRGAGKVDSSAMFTELANFSQAICKINEDLIKDLVIEAEPVIVLN